MWTQRLDGSLRPPRRVIVHAARWFARHVGPHPLLVALVTASVVSCRRPPDHRPAPSNSTAPSTSSVATVETTPPASATPDSSSPHEAPIASSNKQTGSAKKGTKQNGAKDLASEFAFLPSRTVQEGSKYKIAAKALQAWIHLYPDDETPFLGYLRAGTIVDRSPHWVVKTLRCKKGWYEVLPRGYICDGNRATLNLDDPVVKASWRPAKRGEPLPYYYVRPASRRTYLYFTLPSKKDQRRTEGRSYDKWVAGHPTSMLRNLDVLGPPLPLPDFLAPGVALPTPYGATKRLRYNVHEGRANPKAAFALLSVHDYQGRLFGLTTELDLIPIDRTHIIRPPPARGGTIEDLPAGLVRSFGTPRFELDSLGHPHRAGTFHQYQVLDLTGKTHGDLWEVRDGSWVQAGTVMMVQPRTSFPSFAQGDRKWIDVSIERQLLVAYRGKTAVFVTLVSTGLGKMSDPEKSFATVRGTFTIKSKHVTATMTGSRQAEDYELADVPYVQYFYQGYALHGAFWHNDFGRVRSHGCINLTPADAAWLFEFTDPVVPPHWHGVNATEGNMGSVVYVHR